MDHNKLECPQTKAVLIIENGDFFEGKSIGVPGQIYGELIFNTSMFGYQEILTDPSYFGQIITFTTPHIGNVGVNKMDDESKKIWAAGIIVKNLSQFYSNWRAEYSLSEFLVKHNKVGIAGLDTRELVKKIRYYGTLKALILTEGVFNSGSFQDREKELVFNQSKYLSEIIATSERSKIPSFKQTKYRVVVYNFGVKNCILNVLKNLGCEIIVVPWNTPARESLRHMPDGILLSNGPGDPRLYLGSIDITKQLLEKNIPIFGICLGHQILGVACQAEIEKMANGGHHGANHPILDLNTKRVFISSQNHSYALSKEKFPTSLRITHLSLFDDSIQGIEHYNKPAFGFQGHPEASPGPHDLRPLFKKFLNLMVTRSQWNSLNIESKQNAKEPNN